MQINGVLWEDGSSFLTLAEDFVSFTRRKKSRTPLKSTWVDVTTQITRDWRFCNSSVWWQLLAWVFDFLPWSLYLLWLITRRKTLMSTTQWEQIKAKISETKKHRQSYNGATHWVIEYKQQILKKRFLTKAVHRFDSFSQLSTAPTAFISCLQLLSDVDSLDSFYSFFKRLFQNFRPPGSPSPKSLDSDENFKP